MARILFFHRPDPPHPHKVPIAFYSNTFSPGSRYACNHQESVNEVSQQLAHIVDGNPLTIFHIPLPQNSVAVIHQEFQILRLILILYAHRV